jgi:serine/threonine-protein kinase
MPFQLGSIIDGYEFVDILDSSREEVTYRVRNLAEERFECLRVLSKPLQDDPEHLERFLRESRVHARLDHPNIVRFLHATVLNGEPVITTEYVEGVTLAARLEAGAMAVDQAIRYMLQILAALRCAHEQGVVHRAVTPANVILTPQNVAKLTGFSYARASTDPRLTQLGVSLGDVHYMSPEQVKGLAVIDQRSDVYSAGVVLYQLLTGQCPFDALSKFEVMAAQVNTHPSAPSLRRREISPELDGIVLKALEKDPAHRFANAEEFALALQPLLDTPARAISQTVQEAAPLAPHPPSPPPVAAPETVFGFNVNDVVVFGISLLVVAAVFLIVHP